MLTSTIKVNARVNLYPLRSRGVETVDEFPFLWILVFGLKFGSAMQPLSSSFLSTQLDLYFTNDSAATMEIFAVVV